MSWKNTFTPLLVTTDDLLPESMVTHLEQWSAICVSGIDSKPYLQGQLTCNVVALPAQQMVYGAHCDAKGKVWSAFRLFHHRDGYAMFQPASAVDVELRELKKYAIFSKVTIDQSQDVALGLIGTQAERWLDQFSDCRDDVRVLEQGTAVKISAQRWLLLVNPDSVEALLENMPAQRVNSEIWTRFEIQEALPIVTQEQQNEHIPQALNLQALGGISFNKGCYTGQETVARAKYRGINKRALCLVAGDIHQPLNADQSIELERAVGDNWRSAGVLMAHYSFADQRAIGLIVLPNNLESDTLLRIKSQPETRWTLQPLPYSLDDA